jgi:hypothetical protein
MLFTENAANSSLRARPMVEAAVAIDQEPAKHPQSTPFAGSRGAVTIAA